MRPHTVQQHRIDDAQQLTAEQEEQAEKDDQERRSAKLRIEATSYLAGKGLLPTPPMLEAAERILAGAEIG